MGDKGKPAKALTPQPGMVLKRFVDGYRLKKLGPGAEDVLRREVALLHATVLVLHGGLKDANAAMLKSIAHDLDDRERDGWERWYRTGIGAGKTQCMRVVTQLYHRGLAMMMMGGKRAD